MSDLCDHIDHDWFPIEVLGQDPEPVVCIRCGAKSLRKRVSMNQLEELDAAQRALEAAINAAYQNLATVPDSVLEALDVAENELMATREAMA